MLTEYRNLHENLIERVKHMTRLFGGVDDVSTLGCISSTTDYKIGVSVGESSVDVTWEYLDPYEDLFDEHHEFRFELDFFESATDDEIIAFAKELADEEFLKHARDDVDNVIMNIQAYPGLLEYIQTLEVSDLDNAENVAAGYISKHKQELLDVRDLEN